MVAYLFFVILLTYDNWFLPYQNLMIILVLQEIIIPFCAVVKAARKT